MKHIYNLLILFLFSASLNGQVLVKENKLWSNTRKGTEGWAPYESYFIKFQEDTLINSFEYKKVWRCNDSLQSSWYVDGYIREDSLKRVYLYPINNEYITSSENKFEDILVYNFGLNIGDSLELPLSMGYYIYLDSIKNEILENSTDTIKKLFFGAHSYVEAIWYEGIGSSKGILSGLNAISLLGADFYLVCYYENETLKYHNDYFDNCFPRPYPDGIKQLKETDKKIKTTTTSSEIIFDFEKINSLGSNLKLYNLNGQQIYNINLNGETTYKLPIVELPKGIYLFRFNSNNILISDKILISE